MSKAKEINIQKAKSNKLQEMQMQLCWMCRKCAPDTKHHCSWSNDLVPVDGWDVKKYKYFNEIRFHTTGCPDFLPDEVVFALAIDASRLEQKRLGTFRASINRHYGRIEPKTAKFIMKYCMEHEDDLIRRGYDVKRGLSVGVRPDVAESEREKPASMKKVCGTCRYYQRKDVHAGFGYACSRRSDAKSTVWMLYEDTCDLWSRKCTSVKAEESKQNSYIDPFAHYKGGCKMCDCIYASSLSGALNSMVCANMCCNYFTLTGKCRTTGGKHKIINGRCDLYQTDPDKRKKFMRKKKRAALDRLNKSIKENKETK